MLDMSDRQRPAKRNDPSVTPLPVVAVPPKGTVVRHQAGPLFRVEGACRCESGEVNVLFRALDPLTSAELQSCASTAFFAAAGGGQPRFARLRNADPAALRKHLGLEVMAHDDLEAVLRIYDEPWRFFHTREHLYRMFELASNRGKKLTLEQALAVLFHDIVYVPGAPEGQNEQLSALLAQSMKRRVKPANVDWALVCRIIEDTANHRCSDPASALVLDLDLSCLAEDALHFAASNELVWLENRHLLGETDARKDFDTRRLRFLLALAAQGPLFSAEFQDLELTARGNLEQLRQEWQQKYGER